MIGPTKPARKLRPPRMTDPIKVDSITARLLAICPQMTNHQHNATGVMRPNTIPSATTLNRELANCARNTRMVNTLSGNPKSKAITFQIKNWPLIGSALTASTIYKIQQTIGTFLAGSYILMATQWAVETCCHPQNNWMVYQPNYYRRFLRLAHCHKNKCRQH